MRALREWILRLAHTLRPGRTDRDLEEELRAHLELAADDEARSGRDEVTRASVIKAGGVAQAMEALRDQRGLPWLTDFARDVRYGCRMLAANPGFTVVSVLSLAIGIGANCAVFSFADALLLRPLMVPQSDEIVTIGSPDINGRSLQASYPEYLDIRARVTTVDNVVAFTTAVVALASGPQAMATARIGMVVSGNFFDSMRVEPAIGRGFSADEDQAAGRSAVVVLGHEFWVREFGSDRSVIGRTIRLNSTDVTVIGVAPKGFPGLDRYTRFEFFAPLMMWSTLSPEGGMKLFEDRDARRLTLKGRLKRSASIDEAQAELSLLARDLERTYAAAPRNFTLVVRSELRERFAQNPSNVVLISMLAFLATCVLFVACANVAGLLASRAPNRAREIALRLAIGAGRTRIVRQLITESVIIAIAGGAAGLGVAYAAVQLFRQFRIPTDLPIAVSFTLDQRALLAGLMVAVLSAVFFGLAPAMRAARADLTAVMKSTDSAGFDRRHWGRSALVAGQVAMSVLLLAAAAYIYRDFQRQLGAGPGFRRDHLLMMWFDPGLAGYSNVDTLAFYDRLIERVRMARDVKGATISAFVPIDGGAIATSVVPEGFAFPAGRDNSTLWSASVDEHHFSTFKLPILAGRAFTAGDRKDSPRVAVVNDLFAQHYWQGQSAVGKRFRLGTAAGPPVEIVGVVKTQKYSFILETPIEFVYFPIAQRPQSRRALVVETEGDPATAASQMRDLVRSVDARLPIFSLRTVEEVYQMRVVSILNIIIRFVAAIGVMGLVLALVGLYGLVSYGVSRRTKEIGIRMAIGAGRIDVVRMVVRHGAVLASAGLVLGLIASVAGSRAMRTLFPFDAGQPNVLKAATFGTLGLIVLAVTMAAAYLPARRAARINPTEALRHE